MGEEPDYLIELHTLRDEITAIRKMTLGTGGRLEVQVILACNRAEATLNKMLKHEQGKYLLIRD